MHRKSLPTLLVLLAGMLMTALLPLLSAGLSASHDPLRDLPLQVVRHAITSDDPDAARHRHEVEADDSRAAGEGRDGHRHAHSALDHSHESLFAPPKHAGVPVMNGPQWRPGEGHQQDSAWVAVLQRPPRPVTA